MHQMKNKGFTLTHCYAVNLMFKRENFTGVKKGRVTESRIVWEINEESTPGLKNNEIKMKRKDTRFRVGV